MAGASGFLGTRLADRLRAAGPRRHPAGPAPGPARADEATWQPSPGQLDPAAGRRRRRGDQPGRRRASATSAGPPGYKSLLRSSRVDTTGTIARAITQLPAADRPRVAAAVLRRRLVRRHRRPRGHRGGPGRHRLPGRPVPGLGGGRPPRRGRRHPGRAAAHRPAAGRATAACSSRCCCRSGWASAAKLGSGRQWMPWIALADWLAAAEFLLDRDDLAGPVNLVGPAAGHQRRRSPRPSAGSLHRPALLPVPGIALQVALGEFAGEMRRSQRVLPGGAASGPASASPTRTVDAALRGRARARNRRTALVRPALSLLTCALMSVAAAAHRVRRSAGRARRPPRAAARRGAPHLLVAAVALALAGYVTNGLWQDPDGHVLAQNVGRPGVLRVGCWATASTCCGTARTRSSPTLMNAPLGVNLAANTSITVYAVLFAPLTMLAGPQVSFVTILTLNLAGAAFAWYLFLAPLGRHATGSRPRSPGCSAASRPASSRTPTATSTGRPAGSRRWCCGGCSSCASRAAGCATALILGRAAGGRLLDRRRGRCSSPRWPAGSS